MVRKMNGASALLIDILENAISILNNARKKRRLENEAQFIHKRKRKLIDPIRRIMNTNQT